MLPLCSSSVGPVSCHVPAPVCFSMHAFWFSFTCTLPLSRSPFLLAFLPWPSSWPALDKWTRDKLSTAHGDLRLHAGGLEFALKVRKSRTLPLARHAWDGNGVHRAIPYCLRVCRWCKTKSVTSQVAWIVSSPPDRCGLCCPSTSPLRLFESRGLMAGLKFARHRTYLMRARV